MKKLFMIASLVALLVVSLGLTACSGDGVDITGHVVDDLVSIAESPEDVVTASSAPMETASYDLYIFDSRFEPSVMQVKAGQTLEVTITDGYTEEDSTKAVPFVLSFPDFGITERVDAGSIIGFTPEEKGTYEFYCLDCSPKLSGVVIVQ